MTDNNQQRDTSLKGYDAKIATIAEQHWRQKGLIASTSEVHEVFLEGSLGRAVNRPYLKNRFLWTPEGHIPFTEIFWNGYVYAVANTVLFSLFMKSLAIGAGIPIALPRGIPKEDWPALVPDRNNYIARPRYIFGLTPKNQQALYIFIDVWFTPNPLALRGHAYLPTEAGYLENLVSTIPPRLLDELATQDALFRVERARDKIVGLPHRQDAYCPLLVD